MSDTFNCPVCKCGPMITDYCPSCSRIEGSATADQLKQAKVEVLREAGRKLILKAVGATNIPMLTGSVNDYLNRMADEIERAGK